MKTLFQHILVVVAGIMVLNVVLPGPAFAQDKDQKKEEKKDGKKSAFDRIQKAKEEEKTKKLANQAEDEHNSVAGALVSGIAKDPMLMMATASIAFAAAYEGWVKYTRTSLYRGLREALGGNGEALRGVGRPTGSFIAEVRGGWRDLMIDAGVQSNDALRRYGELHLNPLFEAIRRAERLRIAALLREDTQAFNAVIQRLPAEEAAELLERRTTAPAPSGAPERLRISTVNAAYMREIQAYENVIDFIRRNRQELISRGMNEARLDAFLNRTALLSIDRIELGLHPIVASRESLRRFLRNLELFLHREGIGTYNLSRMSGWTRLWNYVGGLRERANVPSLLLNLLRPTLGNTVTRGPVRVLKYVFGIRSIRGPALILTGGAVALYFASQLQNANREALHADNVSKALQQNEDELHAKGPEYYQRPLSALVQVVWQNRRFWEDSKVQSQILNVRYGKRFQEDFMKFEKENTPFAKREEKLKELLDAKERTEYGRRKDFVASFQKSFCFTKDQVHHDRFPFNFENNIGHRLKMKAAFTAASIELQQQGQPIQGDQNFSPTFWNHFWRNIFTEAVGNSPALAALSQDAIFGTDRSGRGGLVEDFAEISPYVFEYLLQTQRDERRLIGVLSGLNRTAREAMLAGIADVEKRQTVALLVPPLPLPDPDDE